MAGRSYSRTDAHRALNPKKASRDEFHHDRVTWTPDSMSKIISAVVYEGEQRAPSPGFETVLDVTISVLAARHRSAQRIILTNLRSDELDVLKAVFDDAFERARPQILERERLGAVRYAGGGEPPISAYRPKPKVIRRHELTPEAERDLLFLGGNVALPEERDDHTDAGD